MGGNMRLRNKKTGEIVDGYIQTRTYGKFEVVDRNNLEAKYEYNTLSELNADWEDYKPAEPLIKDEKIRKAVRAWAEANDIKQVEYLYDGNILWFGDNEIDFKYLEPLALELNEYYTIEELCGSEK